MTTMISKTTAATLAVRGHGRPRVARGRRRARAARTLREAPAAEGLRPHRRGAARRGA